MTAQTISNENVRQAGESRLLRAQLDIVAQSLPLTMWINPSWAFLSMIPFFFPTDVFGYVPFWRVSLALGLHLANGGAASLLYRRFQKDSRDERKWLRWLTAFQAVIGVVWGSTIWLLWINGNAVNNVFVIMPFVGVLWSYAMSRTMHIGVYLASVLPIVVLGSLRTITGDGSVAHGLTFVLPLVFGYTLVLALIALRKIETMLVTGFANDDLGRDLRVAHDEAIRKRFEAETANASKTTFLANMSHELRTPLNAILGFSDIIAHERLGEVGTKRYKEYASDINASGSHLLSIINDILDIAKIESGKMELSPQILNIRDVVEDSLKVVSGRARERRQTIDVHIADDAPMPYADPRAVKQMIINLVGNAIKFTQDEGHIDIYGRKANGGFELCVADNGPGIAADMVDRVFRPFNQIDNRYNRNTGGTGLGLSLVRGLAELHGGKAWMESDTGQGARVYIYFPVANSPVSQARSRAQA
jgi:two-component system, cell cycle sensor histidine kinase PleC